MSLVVPNCGETYFLARMLGQDQNMSISVGLYTAPYQPQMSDTIQLYLNLEPTAAQVTNYARQPLAPGSWTLSAPPAPINATYPSVKFPTLSTPVGQQAKTVYGYFGVETVSNPNGTLVFAMQLPTAIAIAAAPNTTDVNTGPIVLVWGEDFATFKQKLKQKLKHKIDCSDEDGMIDLRLRIPVPRR